jgi:hypothetical protein
MKHIHTFESFLNEGSDELHGKKNGDEYDWIRDWARDTQESAGAGSKSIISDISAGSVLMFYADRRLRDEGVDFLTGKGVPSKKIVTSEDNHGPYGSNMKYKLLVAFF